MDRNFRLLTKKQIYERFDVDYIRKLIEYSDMKNPIKQKQQYIKHYLKNLVLIMNQKN